MFFKTLHYIWRELTSKPARHPCYRRMPERHEPEGGCLLKAKYRTFKHKTMKRKVIAGLLVSIGLVCGISTAKTMAKEKNASGFKNQELVKKLPTPGTDIDGISAFNYAIGASFAMNIPGDIDAQTYESTYADYLKRWYDLYTLPQDDILSGNAQAIITKIKEEKHRQDSYLEIYMRFGMKLSEYSRFATFNFAEVNRAIVHSLKMIQEIANTTRESDLDEVENSLERWVEKWEDYSQQEIGRRTNDRQFSSEPATHSKTATIDIATKIYGLGTGDDLGGDNYDLIAGGFRVFELPWENAKNAECPHVLLTRKNVGAKFNLDGVDFQLTRLNRDFTIKYRTEDKKRAHLWAFYLVRNGKAFSLEGSFGYRTCNVDPQYMERKYKIRFDADSIWLYSPSRGTKYSIAD